jgi:CheY-like chemotaxis protein
MAKTILVVDDEPSIVKIMKSRLEANGYAVMTALGGEEALVQLKEAKPDLILLDIIMPDMDGYQVCRKLKQDPGAQQIPVIMFTADERKGVDVQAREAGAANVVYKPLVAEVLEAVKEIFEGKMPAEY